MDSQKIKIYCEHFITGRLRYREVVGEDLPKWFFWKMYKKIVEIEPYISPRCARELFYVFSHNGCVIDADGEFIHSNYCKEKNKHINWMITQRPRGKKIYPSGEIITLFTAEILDVLITHMNSEDILNLSLTCKWICLQLASRKKCNQCGYIGKIDDKFPSSYKSLCDECLTGDAFEPTETLSMASSLTGYLIPDFEPSYNYDPYSGWDSDYDFNYDSDNVSICGSDYEDDFEAPESPRVQKRGFMLRRSSSLLSDSSP
jgi:hypothetical protein